MSPVIDYPERHPEQLHAWLERARFSSESYMIQHSELAHCNVGDEIVINMSSVAGTSRLVYEFAGHVKTAAGGAAKLEWYSVRLLSEFRAGE